MTGSGDNFPPKRIPVATYRWQFNREFTFQKAAETAIYLRDLGITDCYSSPLFQAESSHGYDIVRFDQFNPQLGGAADFDRMAARLRELGLGLLLDMVPNHMGNVLSNLWWLDVLEKGQDSPYFSFFDIQYQVAEPDLHDKILLPILEDHYAKVLEAGKLQVAFAEGAFSISYYDRNFPLSPSSYAVILHELLNEGNSGFKPAETPRLKSLLETLSRWDATPPAHRPDFSAVQKEIAMLFQGSPEFRGALAAMQHAFNGSPGSLESFEKLDALLLQQHYRLAFWRVGPEEINYRRFFDINDLVSLRMELREVFEATHQLVLQLLKEEKVTGLRIDHPDGLWNPKQYFRRIQESFQALRGGDRKSALTPPPLYVVAEKILTDDEPLPEDWLVDGTTGYDFMNRLNGLFIHAENREAFDEIYGDFAGCSPDFKELAYSSKRQILQTSMISELNALSHRLKRVAGASIQAQDFTLGQIHDVLLEIIANFPVYRTYVDDQTVEVGSPQRDYIQQAIAATKGRKPKLDAAVIDFIQNILLLHLPSHLDESAKARLRRFVMRFQQLTGPVTAKGLEDTAFYNFNRLISLNEVGGNPEVFGVDPDRFHRQNRLQAARWPHSLLATATHDTKRGEDVRARLNVLSEIPEQWQQALARWRGLNADKKSLFQGEPAPHPNDEYFFYQTLLGAWLPEAARPEGLKALRERIAACMLKSIKEAKSRTSWVDPNTAYEEAAIHFVEAALADTTPNRFLDDFMPLQRKVAFFGQINSLAQVLFKIGSPGVPDFYQGTDLWDFSLVDPDNRRPVDYEVRRRMLAELKASAGWPPRERQAILDRLLQGSPSGQVKMYLIWRALELRNLHRELFESGNYVPLRAAGTKQEHVCAFARRLEHQEAIFIVPRLPLTLAQGEERLPVGNALWQDTELALPDAKPGTQYRNVLTDELINIGEHDGPVGLPVAQALSIFPVALLERSTS